MIRIPDRALDGQSVASLAACQAEVDLATSFAARVELAAALFKAANVKKNRLFDEVRRQLDDMCSGARRCMYCEDSAADEVEHFRPKAFYPELAFVWPNYLFACGPCNIAKRSRFAIRPAGADVIHLTRKRNTPPVAPAIGEPLALDPRVEDPMEYLMLDIAGGTFALRPSPGSNAAMKMRAEYTIELVKLNRDVLIRGRKEAFDNYVLRLRDFIAKRDEGSSIAQLDAVISSIKRMQHPTVWNEIRRQQEDISMLGELFEAAPEALGW
jgi:uncharacterized protein (TIGR02646 family)